MAENKDKVREVFHDAYDWIKSEHYSSYDVCDITALPLYQGLQELNNSKSYGKYIYAPFYHLYRRAPGLIRSVSGVKKNSYPQAYALIATALISYIKIEENASYKEDLFQILEILEDSNSADGKYKAWGQPYNWYSRRRIPAHTPRTTVTTQVAQSFLDAFDFFKDEKYLELARQAGNFMIDKMKWDQDADGDVCFPYTSLDQYHIHNANVLSSALLARLHSIDGDERFLDFAMHSLSFTSKHQKDDGSWLYWAPPDKLLGKIDHYHTGFVLESFQLAKNYWKGDFPYTQALEKGTAFYLDQLFEDSTIPKMTPTSLYPIDIQSCAQAIITLGEVLPESDSKKELLSMVYNWTMSHMYDEKNSYFYYRIYNSRVDKTAYIRWGQSWMLRALPYLMK
jgi:polysaccharide biosynthesis protein VpsJ